MPIHIVRASLEADFDAAFAAIDKAGAKALLVGADPYFESRRGPLVALAARHGLPAIYDKRNNRANG